MTPPVDSIVVEANSEVWFDVHDPRGPPVPTLVVVAETGKGPPPPSAPDTAPLKTLEVTIV
jgi:hypothetical protein